MPLISFIIPVYNVEKYLDECIKSILTQNLKEYEIILINDGSTDKSLEICNSYILKNVVKVINQENLGQSSARNRGIKEAKGKYIAFLDSDDYYSNFKIKEIENILLKETSVDLILGKIKVFKNGTKQEHSKVKYKNLEKIDGLNGKQAMKYLVETNQFMISPYSFIVRRSILLENKIYFNEKFRCAEDILFTPQVYVCAKNIFVYNDYFLMYRKFREGQLTGNITLEKEMIVLKVLKELMNYSSIQDKETKKILEKYITSLYIAGLTKIALKDNFNDRKELFKKNIFLNIRASSKRYWFLKKILDIVGVDIYLKMVKSYLRK